MGITMPIKNGALLALVVSFSTSATTLMQNMPAITLQNMAGQEDGTLLKTVPLSAQAARALNETQLSIATDAGMWDTSRSIFKTTVPGIGFSLCDNDNNRCISSLSDWIPGESLSLRLYKIGSLHGGQYAIPSLSIYGKTHPLLRINPPALIVNTTLCGVTTQRIKVTFPSFTLNKNGENLPSVGFKIPVICLNPDDYGKVDLQFTYHGDLIDSNTLPTQLGNIGIQIEDDHNMPVVFNTVLSQASPSFSYRARLITVPGETAHYGRFSADATVLITLR
ncbi:fimbrial protein [Enterobacter cloacae]|uniref:fimbrial protein n=1 Tax=Enterobacter cloacae TaxID=550 RepID=UPI003DA0833F